MDAKTKICLECLGRKMFDLRKRHGLTQLQLACDLDTDISFISAIERGVYKNITLKNLIKISDYFCVSLHYLIQEQ